MPSKKESLNLLRQIAIVVAIVATIVVNVLANALPFNDLTTGEISARFDVLFVPAEYVFSIWGLIYLGLGAYAIYQAQPKLRNDAQLRSLDLPVLIASAANVSWLLLWHYEQFVASFVTMLVLLFSLIAIYRRLTMNVGCTEPSPLRLWTVNRVFSVYLGWIVVATIANLAIMLEFLGFEGAGLTELAWFTIASVAVLVIGGLIAWLRADVAFLLVLVWAFFGLGVRHSDSPEVATVAWTSTAVLAAFVVLSALRRAPDEPEVLMVT